jgi:dolichyl-diphosphooligosaccharide--protein glycosyltransferase
MTDAREATDDLLAEKPDLESDLRDVLAVDDRADGWTFDEVPVDSGAFGELVGRDIVAKDDGEYAVADPDAVRASLDGDEESVTEARSSFEFDAPSFSLPSVSRVEASALGAALAFVALMRTYIYPSVFRGEYVVLPSNDPYLYRYWVEQLSTEAVGVFDLSVLSGLPDAVAKGEPLLVATLWWVTNLLGGADASGAVLAWYPVVSALVVAILTYAIAVRVTNDRRVGLASVAFLAVTPAFAYRTGLGFADHHALDYSWLALTALSLVWLADVERDALRTPKPWLWAVVLGVAIAGQVLAWEAGPLLIAALGVYVALRAITDVRAGQSPLVTTAPIIAGLALASLLSHFAHIGFGWHSNVVAYSPVLLLFGVGAVSIVGEAVRRAQMPVSILGAAEVAGALGGLALVFVFLPSYAEALSQRVGNLLFWSNAAETRSIFAGGPSGLFLGPILELGFAWVFALPMLAIATLRAYRRDQTAWLVLCSYGWYFLVLASLQRRFVGELAPFFAVLAGYAFVVLVAKLDVTALPEFSRDEGNRERDDTRQHRGEADPNRSLDLPDRNTITTIAILLLFVTSAGAVQTGVRHEQVKITDDNFRAAAWIDGYADERRLEYPENYVLSKWGRNRMFNYFVNGESNSYGYARNNYEAFLSSENPAGQYRELRDRVGFVVTTDLSQGQIPASFNYARLHQRFGGVGPNGERGAGHYRAVYASESGATKVFALVPGARVVGSASPGETVTISKQVEIEGETFTYERRVEANPYGAFNVTLPYAGEYSVSGATKAVSEGVPTDGGVVKWHDREGVAHWQFDHVRNGTAHDNIGLHPATLDGPVSNVSGIRGRAVALDGENASVTANVSTPQEFTVSLWVKPDRLQTNAEHNYQRLVNTKNGGLLDLQGNGEVILRLPGTNSEYFAAGDVPVDDWTHVTGTYNGTHRTIYVNGKRVATDRITNGTVDWGDGISLGGRYFGPNTHAFHGAMDEVRIYDRALTPEEVRERYETVNKSAT